MLLEITRGGKVIKTYDTTIERDYLSRNDRDVTNNRVPEVVLKRVKVETKKVQTTAPKAEPKQVQKPIQVQTPVAVKRVVKEIDVSRSNRTEEVEPATSEKHSVEVVLNRPVKSVSEPVEEPKQDRDPEYEIIVHKTGLNHPEPSILQRVTRSVAGNDICVVKAEYNSEHIVEVKLCDEEEDEKEDEVPFTKVELPSEREKVDDGSTTSVIKFGESDEEKPVDEGYEIVEDKDKSSIIPSSVIRADLTPGNMMQAVFFGDEPDYDPEEIKEKEDEDMNIEDPNIEIPTDQIAFIDVIDAVDEDIDDDPTVIMNYTNERDIEPKIGSVVIVRHIYSDEEIEDINVPYVYAKLDEDDEPTWMRTDRDDFLGFDREVLEHIEKHEEASETYVNSNEEEHSEIDDTEEQYPEVEPDIVEDADGDPVDADDKNSDAEEAESTSDNEINVVDRENVVLTNKIPTINDSDEDTVYCVPRHSKVNINDLIDGIDGVYDIDLNKYRIYVRHGDEIISVRCVGGSWYAFDEEAARPIDVLVGNEITFISGPDLPDFEDAEVGTYYLLGTDKEDVYDAFIKRIGENEYSFYLRVTTAVTESDDELDDDDQNNHIDDMLAALKESSKKKSLDKFMN